MNVYVKAGYDVEKTHNIISFQSFQKPLANPLALHTPVGKIVTNLHLTMVSRTDREMLPRKCLSWVRILWLEQ